MKVSVLVNNYDYGEYVCEAVKSALAQTRRPDEIVVIDDGSTDSSLDRLHMEFKSEGSVRIAAKTNGGQLSAFNAAYRESTGDLLFFLDADDAYRPDYIERALAFYARNPGCDFLHCGWKQFGNASQEVHEYPENLDHGFSVIEALESLHWRGGPTSTISLRRAIADRFLPLPLEDDWRIRADDCLVWGAAIAGAHKYYLAEALVRYRVHERNAFYGRSVSKGERDARRYRTNRLVGVIARLCGYHESSLLDEIVREFESTEGARTFADLRRYSQIIQKSKRGSRWRIKTRFRLEVSYWKMRLRRAGTST
jgi:glycosyltransferase involved in cell wall biosynthesis